jgi:hypothetical protein
MYCGTKLFCSRNARNLRCQNDFGGASGRSPGTVDCAVRASSTPEIRFFVRTTAELPRARAAIQSSGNEVAELYEHDDGPVMGISIGTMHLGKGAGFSLSLTGDFVIAAASARFTMAYTAAGLSPDGSSTYFVPRLIGLRKAQELMLTNRTLTAREACDWGLISRVVPDEDLQEASSTLAKQFANGPSHAQSVVKKLLLCSLGNGLEEQMEIEGREIANAAATGDGTEGILAFVEKRKPNFK